MGGHVAGAQQAFARGAGGGQHGVDVHARLIELLVFFQRADGLIGEDGHDGRVVRLPDGDAGRLQLSPGVAGQLQQAGGTLGVRPQIAQRLQRHRAGGGRDGRGEDKGTGVVAHIVADLLGGRHVAAKAGQRLGEGAHDNVHLVLQPEVAGGAPAALADDAQAVGVVHHDAGAVLLRQGADLRQLCNVAAHGEDAVRHDQAAGLLGNAGKELFQLLHIAVLIAQHLAVRELAAVIDAGVVFPVTDHIVAPAHQGADDAQIGLKARGEGDRTLHVHEVRQLPLQLQVHLQGAVEKTGAGAAGAQLFKGADAGLHHGGLRGQPQVVVGAQHDAALALHDDLHVLAGLQRVEIGIDPQLPVLICEGEFPAFFKNIHISCATPRR